MSAIGLRVPQPVVILGAMAAFLALSVALVWWHLSPMAILGAMLAIVGVLLIWIHPYVGLHILIAILFLENVAPSEEGLTITKIIGGLVLLGWMMSMATRRRPGIRFDMFTGAILMLLAWCSLSIIFAQETLPAASRLFTFSQLGLAALMCRSVADTPERIKAVYWSLVLWTLFSTIVGITQYYLGMAGSAAGLIKNKNLMASYIDIAIVCAYLLHGMSQQRGARAFLASTLPVFFLGSALTFSRAGLVALCVALVLIWYLAARRRSFLILFLSAAVLLTLSFVLPETFWRRAGSIVPAIQHQEDTFGSRVRLWKVGWSMIQDKPLTGVGAGNFNVAFPRYAGSEMMPFSGLATHNAYVAMAAEMGLPGLGLYLLLHVVSLRMARRTARWGLAYHRLDLHLMAVAAAVSILSIMIGALSGDAQTLKMLWILLGLAAAIGGLPSAGAVKAPPEAWAPDDRPLPEPSAAWGVLR